jgi:hypothetical protein
LTEAKEFFWLQTMITYDYDILFKYSSVFEYFIHRKTNLEHESGRVRDQENLLADKNR